MLSRMENESKVQNHFKEQMRAYDRWKAEVGHAITEYQTWLADHHMGSPEQELRLHDILHSLRGDRLTIAFVAEFSRGKTELINAIFFADYQRRLLPSEAGRTTMCPTELFYDYDVDAAYIRLLPIETRLQDISIAEYKQRSDEWTTISLDVNSPDQMAAALREVVKIKEVGLEQATGLGLYTQDMAQYLSHDAQSVEIPVWRHALISFPHPLLQQGLTILDTPGLNALGSEPELTLSMLPNAHAVLFVLAADTGVTRSDLDMWQYHIKSYHNKGHKGLIAALNKIDTLWDEMKDEAEVARGIEEQRSSTAKTLGIHVGRVFPISAQKALVAKIKKDQELLSRSRILGLESVLADEILPAKQAIVQETIVGSVSDMLGGTSALVQSRLNSTRKQLEELRQLSTRNADVITSMMRKTRERQAAYNKNMESFQASKRIISQHAHSMLAVLSLQNVDDLVTKTRQDMTDSWTTAGMKNGMKTFFDGARDVMYQVASQAEQTHNVVLAIYRKFQEEHGLTPIKPPTFSVHKYRAELEQLHEKAEAFRNSTVTTMTEQHFVVKKFFISLVSHVRQLYMQCHQEADAWLKEVMVPLFKHVNDNKKMLDQHLETLCKINESRDSLDQKIRDLEKRCYLLERELVNLDKIRERLYTPLPTEPPAQAPLTRAAG